MCSSSPRATKKVSGYTQVDTFTFTPMTQGRYGLEGKDGALYTVVFGVVEENKASLGMPDIVNMQKVTLNQDTNYIPLTAISISPASATLAAKGYPGVDRDFRSGECVQRRGQFCQQQQGRGHRPSRRPG